MTAARSPMGDLRAALAIFAPYVGDEQPTCCEHDVLYVLVDPARVSAEDRARLGELGFVAEERDHHFRSFRFGGA